MEIVDTILLDKVTMLAKNSPRLRMNYNFHQDLDDNCQRLLNALEPGTYMPIHHHNVDELFVILRGRINVTIHDDVGTIIQSIVLSVSSGNYAVSIKAGEWHSVESLESGSVIMEVKEGPYIPHEVGGVLNVMNNLSK